MTDHAAALEFALDAARRGARVAMAHYGRDAKVERKDDGTWVTEADWKVESQIRLHIARSWPEHNVLGEEEGLTAAGGGPPRDGAPVWVVDPIDGTNNFMAGIPVWATLLGLQIDGQSVVGVAHAPALGETYEGAIGLGARLNGDAIAVDPTDSLDEATFVFADAGSFATAEYSDFFDHLIRNVSRSRGFGDFWGHMLVARGAAHLMIETSVRTWDVVPLEPIVREAGGRLTTLEGQRWSDKASCLTTNGALHDEVLHLVERFS